MRVNVYHEELTDEVKIAHVQPRPGKDYIGLQFMLKSAEELHNTPEDDDRSAVTLWVGSYADGKELLRQAMVALDRDMFRAVRGEEPPEGAQFATLYFSHPANPLTPAHWGELLRVRRLIRKAIRIAETAFSFGPPTGNRKRVIDTLREALGPDEPVNEASKDLAAYPADDPGHATVQNAFSAANETAPEGRTALGMTAAEVHEIGRKVGNAQVRITTFPDGVSVEIKEGGE